MTAVVTLSPCLQYLVDSRLDSVERALLGANVSRAERREITQSVEDQILELLSRQGETEPTRDGVLTVLAMIDPPEAYIPADFAPQFRCSVRHDDRPDSSSSDQRLPHVAPLAITSCVLGLISLVTLPVIPLFAVAGVAATNSGSVALAQIHYSGRSLKGVWPSIVGISVPIAAMAVLFALVSLG